MNHDTKRNEPKRGESQHTCETGSVFTKSEEGARSVEAKTRKGKRIDLTGQKIGRLTVVSFFGKKPNKTAHFWNCLCACGNQRVVNQQKLVTKMTKSCGCLSLELRIAAITTHGHSKRIGSIRNQTPTYRTWMSMNARCNCKTNDRYLSYGGRGITVCERWKSFEAFLEDMGARPKGTTIERLDNSLGYSKENCRWATVKQQQNNTRRNRIIEFNGVVKNLTQWATEIGIRGNVLATRLNRGWSIERAFTTPVFHPRSLSSNTEEAQEPPADVSATCLVGNAPSQQ